jgi:hypothetical protein
MLAGAGIPVTRLGNTDLFCAKSMLLEIIPIAIQLLRFMLSASTDEVSGALPRRR